jgi:small conductance mechanosensitive channel
MDQFIQGVINELNRVFQPENLGTLVVEWLVKLTSAVLVFALFYLAWLIINRIVRSLLKRSQQDETTRTFITTLTKYTVLIIGGLTALNAGGVDISAVLASLGIAGITIGFAARDAFSNLISGLLIFLDRPFVIGDLIEVGGNYGLVDQITLRSTRIITPDGRMLAVPNSEMINKTVASYTNFPHIRLDMDFTIGVEEDIQRARELILTTVRDDDSFLEEPEPLVLVQALNDYNIQLQLRVWLEDERLHIGKRAQLRELIFNTLNDAGVDMPFETIQLTHLDVSVNQEKN